MTTEKHAINEHYLTRSEHSYTLCGYICRKMFSCKIEETLSSDISYQTSNLSLCLHLCLDTCS